LLYIKYRPVFEEPDGNRLSAGCKSIWEDNIKINLKNIGVEV
jgi:hypothetical protein